MAPLVVPERGLGLLQAEGLGESSADSPRKPTQIMRLNLAQNTLDELIDSLRKDQKVRIRLGKHSSLHFGSRSQPFYSYPESNRSELYISSPDVKDNLYFSGVLSHSLEVQKAKNATASTDEALANLEQSLSAFRQGKESKKTPLITSDQMRALGAGDNRTATGREAASLARMSTSKADIQKEKFFKNTAGRSSSATPTLLASRSPAIAPTSAPVPQNKDKIRMEALRVPLIHLLAVRPVSVKFLAQKTRSSQEDCLALVRKFGTENRLNREKYDLRDKAYKELDVWKFPYPSDDERQEAIDNAISAFDRMRISKHDKLWQMLLPKQERGKGKVLSRLNLRTDRPQKSVTPRIHVHPSEEPTKEGYGTGNESEAVTNGMLTPNTPDVDIATSKKAAATKKRPATTTKRAAPKPKNTTITGKVTKKTEKVADKKAVLKPDAKFKSAEFIVDSDDDVEMADVNAPRPTASKAANARQKSPSSQEPKPSAAMKMPSLASKDIEKTSKPKSSASKTIPTSTATSRSTNNSSPQKPSPLGSSPPTNASDFESAPRSSNTNESSSSSSPLIHQLPRAKTAPATKPAASSQPKRVQKTPALANPLKRKANTDTETTTRTNGNGGPMGLGITQSDARMAQHKRRRPSTVSSGDSTSGDSTPSTSVTLLRQKLREKSQQFKRYYKTYQRLHEELSNDPAPPEESLQKLVRQHDRLQKMKQEIWDEDRRLRMG